MLKTRLWVGSLLILLGIGVLVLDVWLAPWYPVLLVTALAITLLACHELMSLLPPPGPRPWTCYVGVAALILACWPAHVCSLGQPWQWLAGTTVAVLALLFLVEAAQYREPGEAVTRVSLGFWVVGYVGLMGSFCVLLRWVPWGELALLDERRRVYGSLALALTIFVPKIGDTGAYFTGRLLGRHAMAPVLSPKKTWEGAAGGLSASVLVALGINALGTVFAGAPLMSWYAAVGFGVAVGVAAMMGDLVESLIKRDTQKKDASALVPGMGGVLDVMDSILFSAPLAYLWIVLASG